MANPHMSQATAGGPDKTIPAMPATQLSPNYSSLPEIAFAFGGTPVAQSNRLTPDILAGMLISNHHIHLVDGTPIIWNGSMYEVGANRISRAMVTNFPGVTSTKRKEVMEYIMLLLDDEPMADARYIAFLNGIYDLESDSLLPNSPEFLIPNTIPHLYNPDAFCAELSAALDQWACDSEDVRANLEEVLGLAMYRGNEHHIIPLLLGDGGNGKSSYMHLAQGMIGHGNYSVIDPSEFGRAFSRTALMGMLAYFCDDMSRDRLGGDAASVLRKLASGDEIDAEYKYGSHVKFRPYGTPILSCNEFPGAKDDSMGWWRRFRAIPFNALFGACGASMNVGLSDILSSEIAYEHAIILGIQGLRRVMQRHDLTPLPDRAKLLDDIRKESSTVYAFACDELGFGTEGAVDIAWSKPADLYNRYERYCAREGIRYPEKRRSFTRKLGKLYNMRSENVRVDGMQGRRFVPKC